MRQSGACFPLTPVVDLSISPRRSHFGEKSTAVAHPIWRRRSVVQGSIWFDRTPTPTKTIDLRCLVVVREYAIPNAVPDVWKRLFRSIDWKFRTNLRSHELWRETAGKRAKRPPGGHGKSGAMAEKPVTTGPLKGRFGPRDCSHRA